jgi:hypothetical protein
VDLVQACVVSQQDGVQVLSTWPLSHHGDRCLPRSVVGLNREEPLYGVAWGLILSLLGATPFLPSHGCLAQSPTWGLLCKTGVQV